MVSKQVCSLARGVGTLPVIFVDVTQTVQSNIGTGIQRMVRRVTAELAALLPAAIMPVVAREGRFHPLNEQGQQALLGRTPPARSEVALKPRSRLLPVVQRLLARVPPVYDRVHEYATHRATSDRLADASSARPITPGSADTVLLLDSYWGGSASLAAAEDARSRGTKIAIVVYDLIPMSHPQYMHSSAQSTFGRRMRRALRLADRAFAISRHCAGELGRFFPAETTDIAVEVLDLGHDFDGNARSTGVPAAAPVRDDYVMIGTLEPRKGHEIVLEAFHMLWTAGGRQTLTLVGKTGWADPALLDTIASLAQDQPLFRHLENASDADLADVLARADATIVASRIEGFGLPVVESLGRGVPVIASDIPVFREVAGEAALFFEDGDAASLVGAIRQFASEREQWRRRAAAFVGKEWRRTAEQLLGALAPPRSVTDA